jgi:glutamate synthase (NADPH) large chain
MCFLPVERQQRLTCEGLMERISREEGLTVLGWRDAPVEVDAIGRVARASQPYIEQFFVARPAGVTQDEFERKLYLVRKRAEAAVAASDMREKDFFYVPSFSSRTIIYKGLLLAEQIGEFYNELLDPETESAR